MKKILPIALALALALALAVPALAANETTGSTNLTTTIGSSYTAVIPDTTIIAFGDTSTSIGNIGLSAAQLAPGTQVTFTTASLTAAGAGTLKDGSPTPNTLAYVMKIDGTGINTASFSTATTKPVTVEITTAAWNAAPAGTYTDTITFAISVA